MKRMLLPLLAVLLLTTGCFYITSPFPSGNQGTTDTTSGQPPTSYIDAITPPTPAPGQTITFTGHGTDPDGQVVGFKWRSSISGDLSNLASFQTSSLGAGAHTIYFSVQDNKGNWSTEVTSTLTIASAPAMPPPVINSFYVTPGTILSGNSAVLNWNVSNAASVTIDQGIGTVAQIGTRAVTPPTTMIYTITATNSLGSVMAMTQVTVISSLPPGMPTINSFFANPAVVVKGNSSTLNWSVSNATSIQIDQGIGSVTATGTISVTPTTSTAYTLTASNSYGWVSQTIVVSVFTYIPGYLLEPALKIDPNIFQTVPFTPSP